MKLENQLRLALMAVNDTYSGSARCLDIVKRMKRICGGEGTQTADEIVSRVYSDSNSVATFECRECGQEWATREQRDSCCAEANHQSTP